MVTAESLAAGAPSSLLSRERVHAGCCILLAIETVLFLFLTAGTYGLIVPLPTPTSTDFVSFYAAGKLADTREPELAYDKVAHYAAEQRAAEPGIVYNYFFYPPVFLLLCAALARLPYFAAFVAFEAITLGLYLPVMRRILGERSSVALVPILAFPPILWTIGMGQNGLLTAGLFGAATLAPLDRGIAVRHALHQAAFRLAGSSGARRRRAMAGLRWDFDLFSRPQLIVSGLVRLADVARFSRCGRRIGGCLRGWTHSFWRLCYPIRRGNAARGNSRRRRSPAGRRFGNRGSLRRLGVAS